MKKKTTPQKIKMSEMNEKELRQEIRRLNRNIKTQKEYISHLEKLSQAYENLKELSQQELKDADKVIRAQEILQDFMSEEQKRAEEIIRAHEFVEQYSAKEIEEARKTIEAQENVQGLMTRERQEAEKVIHAHEMVEQLSAQEIEEAYRVIEAHERVHGLSRLELEEADKEIRAREKLSGLSEEEIRHRDTALLKVLEISRAVSSILNQKKLYQSIVDQIALLLEADRVTLCQIKDSRLQPLAFHGMNLKKYESKEFNFAKETIRECLNHSVSKLQNKLSVKIGSKTNSVSQICVPLFHQKRLVGILYIDKIGENKIFYSGDRFVTEIFAQQAVISMNNAELFRRIKDQNWQLLRLLNLKNQFVSRLSDYLKDPVGELNSVLLYLENEEQLSDKARQMTQKAGRITRTLSKTANRVLTLVELEKEVEDLYRDRVNFNEILNTLKEKYKQDIDKRQLSIQKKLIPELESYPANQTIIRTIIDEVFGNAVMYNRQNGSVTVSGKKGNEYLYLIIEDTGCGITEEDREHVFEQFFRSEHSMELNEAGAGLGLYMAKNFLAYYQGQITFESSPKGSRFTLSFLIP